MTVENVAKHWGGTIVRLISHRENAVYEMVLPNGQRAALRQHRPGYQSRASIMDEVMWTKFLASSEFPCPMPLQNRSGEDLVDSEEHIFSAVSWVDGRPIAEQNQSTDSLVKTYFALGRLLSQLHDISDWMPDDIHNRPAWSVDGLLGPDPFWGRFWETPPKDSQDAQTLHQVRKVAHAWLSGLQEWDQGLIHADAIGENVLGSADDLWLIDFDDSGTGFRAFDLGVTLTQHWDAAYLTDIATALIEGYTDNPTERQNLGAEVFRFMTLRCLASAGWVQGRMPENDPRRQTYVTRAVTCGRRYFDV